MSQLCGIEGYSLFSMMTLKMRSGKHGTCCCENLLVKVPSVKVQLQAENTKMKDPT